MSPDDETIAYAVCMHKFRVLSILLHLTEICRHYQPILHQNVSIFEIFAENRKILSTPIIHQFVFHKFSDYLLHKM